MGPASAPACKFAFAIVPHPSSYYVTPSRASGQDMTEYSFSRFVYFDTNIVSHFAKDESLWPKLFDFLKDNDLTMGIGAGQIAELSDAKRLHRNLVRFFVSVPTGIVKNWYQILAEEVEAHPDRRSDTLLMYPLNAILLEEDGFEKLIRFLSSKRLTKARNDQLRHARQVAKRHDELKKNFPPKPSGSYTQKQGDEFAQAQVFQWLSYDHRQFLQQFQDDIKGFHPETFLSVRLFGYVIFYKYYLGQRQPKRLSDFGDLFHLFPIPYCELAVMERDLCNILHQIKSNHTILESTDVQNIDFVRGLR
jgi:hypothetical protein